ncbi:MAG: hypothetical protein LQ343_002825 [Gyalolechia ehrenbergii]|nr:MAG: hypothetical protein LQ343_002825 [Gyalolechia ehrenbergii]
MPLIVPDLNPTSTSSSSQQQEWTTKLLGKTLTSDTRADNLSFAKQDLPKDHRIVEPGAMLTQDYRPERLNIHLGEDGTVRHVDFK